MATYTNTAPGARGINLKDGGTVLVEAGGSIELDVAKVALAHPDLASDAKDEDAKRPGLTGKTKAELIAIAADEQVPDVSDSMTVNDIIASIELHREG